MLLLGGQAAHSTFVRERGATRKSRSLVRENGAMQGEQGALLTEAGQNRLDMEVFILGPQTGFSHFTVTLLSQFLCNAVSLSLFFLQLEVGGVRGYD